VRFPLGLRFAALYFTSFLYLNKQGKYRSSRRTCGFFGKLAMSLCPLLLPPFDACGYSRAGEETRSQKASDDELT